MDLDIVSLAPAARRWLERSQHARVLHVFEPVCNLVSAQGEVLSLVAPGIGNGPFSAVVERGGFDALLNVTSSVQPSPPILLVGDMIFKYRQAKDWEPTPEWGLLRGAPGELKEASTQIDTLLKKHAEAESFAWLVLPDAEAKGRRDPTFTKAGKAIEALFSALFAERAPAMREAASDLAGLGSGLTPAGDDLLVGVMHALWATRPHAQALALSLILAEAATPRTNSLSAAWLNAAARGEAGEPWHWLADAIVKGDGEGLESAVMRILPTGHSSGADALGGFAAFVRLDEAR